MSEVDDKIRLLQKVIQDRIREEKQQEFDAHETERIAKIGQLRQKMNEMIERELGNITRVTNQRKVELVSREKMLLIQEELKLRESFITNIMEEIIRKADIYMEGEEYKKTLIKSVKSVIGKLSYGSSYCLYLTEHDYEKVLKELAAEIYSYNQPVEIVITSRNIIGGFLIEDKNKKFRLDNSFQKKLIDLKEYIGLSLDENLKRG